MPSSLRPPRRLITPLSGVAGLGLTGAIPHAVWRTSTDTQHVQALGQTMDTRTGSLRSVRQWIEEISGALHEPSPGRAPISQAVAKMDRSTQQNAALVEKSAAAASVRNDQAHPLAQTVGAFQLGDAPPQGPALAGPAAPASTWTAARLH